MYQEIIKDLDKNFSEKRARLLFQPGRGLLTYRFPTDSDFTGLEISLKFSEDKNLKPRLVMYGFRAGDSDWKQVERPVAFEEAYEFAVVARRVFDGTGYEHLARSVSQVAAEIGKSKIEDLRAMIGDLNK